MIGARTLERQRAGTKKSRRHWLTLPADEALYGAAWSAKDAWVMAGLSADGRVFVSHVPSSEKYKILL